MVPEFLPEKIFANIRKKKLIDPRWGLILFNFNLQRQRNLSFLIAIISLIMCFNSTIYRDMNLFVASVVILIGRPIIGISICWLIITNACGYNCKSLNLLPSCDRFWFIQFIGMFLNFLSAKFFVRANKLTYAFYLLNPIIISVLFSEFDNGGTVDTTLYFILIIGIFYLTYWAAVVFSLLFEIPFYKLSNEMLKESKPIAKKVDWVS